MEFYKVLPFFLLLMSLVFLSMALFVLIRKNPLIVNSNWMLVFISLCFLPQMLTSVQMCFERPSFIGVFPILMFGVLIGWFVFMMKGFTIYGADGTDFQKALIECLNDKDYEYEQTLSSLRIKNPELELSVAIQSWVGTAQIRFKGKANHEVLNEIIRNLKSKEIKTNLIFPIFYLLIGIMISIVSISLITK